MSAKICFMCSDALSCTSPEAKKYTEDGIPPCADCLQDLIEQEERQAEDEAASWDAQDEIYEEPSND
jgi:hypothetical protein